MDGTHSVNPVGPLREAAIIDDEQPAAARDGESTLIDDDDKADTDSCHILNVPNEVLSEIFASLADDQRGSHLEPKFINEMKNCRLVCRGFERVAGSFLLPRVEVYPTLASLERLQAIAKHDSIRRSVRRIKFRLYRYKSSLAKSLAAYAEFCITIIFKAFNDPDRTQKKLECCWGPEVLWGVDRGMANQIALSMRPAVESWERLKSSAAGATPKPTPTPVDIPYWELLASRHAEYRRLYEEQVELLTTGDFFGKVAKALDKMGLVRSIEFRDSKRLASRFPFTDFSIQKNGQVIDPLSILRNHDFLIQPECFLFSHGKEAEGSSPTGIYPQLCLAPFIAKTVCALDARGKPLKNLTVKIWKKKPLGVMGTSTLELLKINKALRCLQSFHFYSDNPIPASQPDSRTLEGNVFNRYDTNRFLAPFLALPNLQKTRIKLRNVGAQSWDIRPREYEFIAWAWPTKPKKYLRVVTLSGVSTTQQHLEALVWNSPGQLERLELHKVFLEEGTWHDVVEFLRGCVCPRKGLQHSRGAELGLLDGSGHAWTNIPRPSYGHVVRVAGEYIRGEAEEKSFRILQKDDTIYEEVQWQQA